MDDLLYSSAKQITQAIREKRVSCVEVIQAYLERIGDAHHRCEPATQRGWLS